MKTFLESQRSSGKNTLTNLIETVRMFRTLLGYLRQYKSNLWKIPQHYRKQQRIQKLTLMFLACALHYSFNELVQPGNCQAWWHRSWNKSLAARKQIGQIVAILQTHTAGVLDLLRRPIMSLHFQNEPIGRQTWDQAATCIRRQLVMYMYL